MKQIIPPHFLPRELQIHPTLKKIATTAEINRLVTSHCRGEWGQISKSQSKANVTYLLNPMSSKGDITSVHRLYESNLLVLIRTDFSKSTTSVEKAQM